MNAHQHNRLFKVRSPASVQLRIHHMKMPIAIGCGLCVALSCQGQNLNSHATQVTIPAATPYAIIKCGSELILTCKIFLNQLLHVRDLYPLVF